MTSYPLAFRGIVSTHGDLVSIVGKRVSARIRERRHALGYSQSNLAELAGVSPELVSRIERGRCLPSLHTLVTFSNCLRTTPNDLLGFEQPLADEELRPLLDAIGALGPEQRAEIRRIAEALAKYGSQSSQPTPAPRYSSHSTVPPSMGFGSTTARDHDSDLRDTGIRESGTRIGSPLGTTNRGHRGPGSHGVG